MTVEVEIRHRQGAFTLDVAFASAGRLTALFGSSGAGKTSIVNMLAGLVRPQEGRIAVDGRVLFDSAARVHLPPHRRRIGYVFQDARLFPHMTVARNLVYGRFFTPRGDRYAEAARIVDLLGIGHLMERRPAMLSGGEKQRVAIGRALIASPRLLLMDEPLASLDEERKAEILPYVERLRDDLGVPIVYVSHALAEVARLATDIVRLDGGRVVASGPAGSVLPAIGLPAGSGARGDGPFALLPMEVAALEPEYGLAVLKSSAGEWRLPSATLAVGQRLGVRVEASDVIVATEYPSGLSALNIVPATIGSLVMDRGGRSLVELVSGSDRFYATITPKSLRALALAPGREVFAVVKSVAIDGIATAAPAPADPRR